MQQTMGVFIFIVKQSKREVVSKLQMYSCHTQYCSILYKILHKTFKDVGYIMNYECRLTVAGMHYTAVIRTIN